MKKILFDAVFGSNWIGGMYYLRNIIFQMQESQQINQKYTPVVLVAPEYRYLFDVIDGEIEIIEVATGDKKDRLCKLLKLIRRVDLIFYYHRYKFDLININEKKGIYWIPDFQDRYYPEYFENSEQRKRFIVGNKISSSNRPLILSSKSCYKDFCEFYPSKEQGGVYVVPFASAIEEEIRTLTNLRVEEILRKYELQGKKFVLISNQFWQHKNHIIVFKAIEEYVEQNSNNEVEFVFTGILKDNRNPAYIDSIKEIIENPKVKVHIKMLGFIDRDEQLAIMKEAEYIIQPSLFEGWGTVVEDAKVLDKTILLSDIPVHHEQKNDKCIIFDPHNAAELAKLIHEENQKVHFDDVEAGIADMKARAKEYAKGLEQLFNDLEKKK